MTIRDLDRLVSKTELTPATKQALRHVRKAVISGRATNPEVRDYDWSVCVYTSGNGVRLRFSLKRPKPNDND